MNRRLIEMIAKVNAEIPIGRSNSKEVEQERTSAEGLAEADEETPDSTESKEISGKTPKRDLVERLLEVNRRIPFGGGNSKEIEPEKTMTESSGEVAPKRSLVEIISEVNREMPIEEDGSKEVEEEKPAPIRGTITFVTKDSPLYQQMKPKK